MPPAIAYGGAFIVLVAAFIVAWGLLTVYRLSLKPLLLGLASLFYFSIGGLGFSLGRPLGRIGDAIKSLAESIDHGLAEAVLASEHGIVWLWHALAKQAEWLGNLLGDLAETFEAKFRAWYLAFPPLAAIWLAVRAARELPALWQAIHGAKASVTNVTEKVYRQGAHITNVTKNYVTKVAYAAAGATAGTIALPAPWLRTRLRAIEGDVSALAKRLTPAAVVALIGATIFKTFRLSWLRCPGVNRVGRALCGLTPLIETLFSDVIEAFLVTHLCDFIAALSEAMRRFQPLLIGFVDVEDVLIGCNGATKPEALNVPILSLPPVTGLVTQ